MSESLPTGAPPQPSAPAQAARPAGAPATPGEAQRLHQQQVRALELAERSSVTSAATIKQLRRKRLRAIALRVGLGTFVPTLLTAIYLGFSSADLDPNQITDYLTRVVQPKLSAISGVQRADILGARTFAMRIWLQPDRMAAHGISRSVSAPCASTRPQRRSKCWSPISAAGCRSRSISSRSARPT